MEGVIQFHVRVWYMYLTLYAQVSLIIFSGVGCIVWIIHTDDTVSTTMAGKDDG